MTRNLPHESYFNGVTPCFNRDLIFDENRVDYFIFTFRVLLVWQGFYKITHSYYIIIFKIFNIYFITFQLLKYTHILLHLIITECELVLPVHTGVSILLHWISFLILFSCFTLGPYFVYQFKYLLLYFVNNFIYKGYTFFHLL